MGRRLRGLSLTTTTTLMASLVAVARRTEGVEFASRTAALRVPYGFPLVSNSLRENLGTEEEAEALAKKTYPVAPLEARSLFEDFLGIKRRTGSAVEKALYAGRDAEWLTTRLATKRPLVFMNGNDSWSLRSGLQGAGGWEGVGTDHEEEPLVLKDYLSYDEVALSALCGVSSETYCINRGDRFNQGKVTSDHEPWAVYVGLVGTRFERPGQMEWRHMIIDEESQGEAPCGAATTKEMVEPQDSSQKEEEDEDEDEEDGEEDGEEEGEESRENGSLLSEKDSSSSSFASSSSSSSCSSELRRAWAKFYGVERFATLDDDLSGERFLQLGDGEVYLDAVVYKSRVKKTARVFLSEANERARAADGKETAYAHVVGLGLGVWQIHAAQNDLFVDAFLEEIADLELPRVKDVDFSWILSKKKAKHRPTTVEARDGTTITLHYSKRDPFERLDDPTQLVVAMFAWDANSYPGNEYWLGSLAGSGDPAAASCSAIGELMNPDVNAAALQGDRARWY